MSKAQALVDANVILRFLLADHDTLSPRAQQIFQRAAAGELELLITATILAECSYTLKSFYKMTRVDSTNALKTVLSLPGVAPLDTQPLKAALQLFGDHNVDFADAYLAALGNARGLSMATFDRDLGKMGAAVLD